MLCEIRSSIIADITPDERGIQAVLDNLDVQVNSDADVKIVKSSTVGCLIDVQAPRTGYVIQRVVSGCSCMPLTVVPSSFYGRDFQELTEGLGNGHCAELDGELDGECPVCRKPTRYARIFVVIKE
jgi:hypothetical protein